MSGQVSAPRFLLGAGLSLLAASAVLWMATGREGFTRWPSAELAASDRPTTDEDTLLLSSLGFEAAPGDSEPQLINRFAFGLMPGGFDIKHLPSVFLSAGVSGMLFGASAFRSFTIRRSQGGIS
jgi:hypothetical protein